MKSVVALIMLALIAPVAASAQSRSGQPGSLGNHRANKRPTVASIQQLDRAKKLADQARARTGAGSRRSVWAYGK